MKQDSASRTAEYIALFRGLETLKPTTERLFDDPYARHFLTPSLRLVLLLGRLQSCHRVLSAFIENRWPGALTSGIARTKLIDDITSTAITKGARQIVLLGAGFDYRPYRLSGIDKVLVYEVDHPATSDRKQRAMRRVLGSIPTNVHFVRIDFNRNNLEVALKEAGYDFSVQTLFIWEGVTGYLTPSAVDTTFRCCSSAAGNSQIVFTYIDKKVLVNPGAFYGIKSVGKLLNKANERWTFGMDHPTIGQYLQERGFVLEIDQRARQYRQTYYGKESDEMKGFEFHHVAVARVRN